MNDQPLTEIFLWDLYRQFFELLMTGLLVAVAVHVVAMLILIFCLCWQATRAGRKNAVIEEGSPSPAGASTETLNNEHPAWNVGSPLPSSGPRVATQGR